MSILCTNIDGNFLLKSISYKCFAFLPQDKNKKAHGLKAQTLNFILGSSPRDEQKIANIHPNKCKHPPIHLKLLVAKVYF